jgi:hypothetical protein
MLFDMSLMFEGSISVDSEIVVAQWVYNLLIVRLRGLCLPGFLFVQMLFNSTPD